jgi:hypothetical protein
MEAKKPAPNAAKPDDPRTEKEEAAAMRARDRFEAAPQAPRIKVSKDEAGIKISRDHPSRFMDYVLLSNAFGTANSDFMDGLLNQLVSVSGSGREPDEKEINFLLSMVSGVKPADQIEAILAAQMGVIHTAVMTFGRRLGQVETIEQQDSAERALNKLARTFAMQIEALKRYRTGGEQRVTVQHVTVSDGGQAIVGNVTQAPRESKPEEAASLSPVLGPPGQSPMPILDDVKPAPARLRRSKKNDG